MTDSAETVARPEINQLYDVADDHEAAVLDRLREKAGITWECYGPDGERSCWTNVASNAVCEHCGTPRPALIDGDEV